MLIVLFVKTRITIHREIKRQVTEVSIGLVNIYPVLNFTDTIHVPLIMPTALGVVKLDTSNRFVKLLFISLQVILNFVIRILLIWVIRINIYDLQHPEIHFIFENDYISPTVLFTILLPRLAIPSSLFRKGNHSRQILMLFSSVATC
ncbi:uncharacterized protein Smp_202200 [Schistosoma mansoni]|uniref:Uncharacterized protein n=1 Tax=Schistosoma mansoni TaxID=6183 RepID=G4VGA1_SCHMA|nr:uncharacterized protein Smp_202200 [Schistosoma mansoni]|eukprot:XP_018651568.1 uncharacterized protein Smp_202200 [Schistosoma mansoni]